jgi:hypothetical protein
MPHTETSTPHTETSMPITGVSTPYTRTISYGDNAAIYSKKPFTYRETRAHTGTYQHIVTVTL